ncbi:MAG: glycine zipper 2TM domain-containing protein [Betaproteobacteria bacterium]
MGALLGGLLGSAFGRGGGRATAAATGAAAGALVGDRIDNAAVQPAMPHADRASRPDLPDAAGYQVARQRGTCANGARSGPARSRFAGKFR